MDCLTCLSPKRLHDSGVKSSRTTGVAPNVTYFQLSARELFCEFFPPATASGVHLAMSACSSWPYKVSSSCVMSDDSNLAMGKCYTRDRHKRPCGQMVLNVLLHRFRNTLDLDLFFAIECVDEEMRTFSVAK